MSLFVCENVPDCELAKEVAAGNRVLCGSVVLGADPGPITQRVANELYMKCRNGELCIPQFPDFNPLLAAMKEDRVASNAVEYKVCTEKVGNLVILSSLARKWLEYSETKEEAQRLVDEHNKHFNSSGDILEDDERPNLAQHLTET